ncbi:MAG: hypothetical protein AMS17_01690 [Spirochaetes bacterium DG_61]|nr:MAG: hypothetical protein AMS17_01690 [Spirochaetes bacterium DG_61]
MREYRLLEDIPLEMVQDVPSRYSFEYYDPDRGKGEGEKYDTIGPLLPPLLLHEQEKYEILQGKLFVDHCRLKTQPLSYGLLITNKSNDFELLRFLVYFKREIGGFNTIEKAMAVSRFYEITGRIPEELLMLLEIPKNEKYVKSYLQLSQAPDEVKLEVLRGNLHENTAFEIFRFAEESWQMLTEFISRLYIGTKKRNEILDMLRTISDGESVNVERILKSDELAQILESGIDPPQIASKVNDFIIEKRYPAMSRYRKGFDGKLKEVDFGRDFHLTLPKDFEQWEFSLNIKFSSVEELKEKIEELKKISASKSFSELMKLRY